MGNILTVIIHAANIHDTVSGVGVAKAAHGKYPSIQGFCGDMGYKGTFVTQISKIPGIHVDISEKIKPHAWEKLRWRWVVERTFGWLNHSRRLSKDYEITTDSAAAMVIISHCHTLLKRL